MSISNEDILKTFKEGEVEEVGGQIVDSRFVKTVYENNVPKKVIIYDKKQ